MSTQAYKEGKDAGKHWVKETPYEELPECPYTETKEAEAWKRGFKEGVVNSQKRSKH